MASPRVIDPSALASITALNLILSAGFSSHAGPEAMDR